MKILLPLAAVLLSLATLACAGSTAPTLRKSPDLAKGVAAFPRLEGAGKAVTAINKILDEADTRAAAAAKSCAEDSDGKGHWTRDGEVTLRSARFISFRANDDYFCGGPYPDTSVLALVFDLDTGAPVDWKRLIPSVAERSSETAADETPVDTVSSPELLALFNDASTKSGADADCKDALDAGEPIQFLIWPGAKTKGLAIAVPGLPHAVRACGGPLTIPADKLKAMRADASLVEAIETAAGSEKAPHGQL
jgi:hypothetical protein